MTFPAYRIVPVGPFSEVGPFVSNESLYSYSPHDTIQSSPSPVGHVGPAGDQEVLHTLLDFQFPDQPIEETAPTDLVEGAE
jgi:hypothetical protein